MKKLVIIIIKKIQITLLHVSYFISNLISQKKINGWVIGVDEVGLSIYSLGNILKPSTTVCFSELPLFELKYDYFLCGFKNIRKYYRLIYGPILLGYLSCKNTHFWYVWHTGFLLDREYEFKFLKLKNKKIVCHFLGDDIRSLKLSKELALKNNIDDFSDYYQEYFYSKKYDDEKKDVARIADDYADVIFSLYIDQVSYLKSTQFAIPYVYDKNNFYRDDFKFQHLDMVKILHAPSNIFLKGTPLVRAAIKKLQIEGYKFEYIELINSKNKDVIKNLKDSHIVINHLYLNDIGISTFGLEAMAHHTALLMSYEPSRIDLYKHISLNGFSECILNTKYWQIYDNLKFLLDNPEKIKYYADNGYEFAYKHYTIEAASRYINNILEQNGVI